jgi:hypothetical protein
MVDLHHRRRWLNADFDQALDDICGFGEVEPKPAQQREPKHKLDDNDKSQCGRTIARAHWLKCVCRGGHPRQLQD